MLVLLPAPASAAAVTDAANDFLPSYTGPKDLDLDVTGFSVSYNASAASYLLLATFAGAIDPAKGGFYVIGVDTGAGAIRPFAPIGQGQVIFDQAIVVQKNGTGTVSGAGGGALAPGSVGISGNALSITVPTSLMPTTGFDVSQYSFNLWPRSGPGGAEVISDFSPENALLGAGSVPEPASWTMMLGGFGLVGGAVRRARGRRNPLAIA